jgi:polar amino acid transport system substrate-binding protein
VTPALVHQLAPTGSLRAAINMSNFLLVTGRSASGDPEGVAPDMARGIADRLGVPIRYVPFSDPGSLADAAGRDVWDIGLIGAEPQRAEKIAFSPAYVEIESTYLVAAGSRLRTIADVDSPGVRIAAMERSAFGLWLDRNIRHATVVRAASLDASFERFTAEKLDALAGLRPRLIADARKVPGSRVLEGRFMSVRQAIGTAPANRVAIEFIRDYVEDAKRSGVVAALIEKHGARGLTVAQA